MLCMTVFFHIYLLCVTHLLHARFLIYHFILGFKVFKFACVIFTASLPVCLLTNMLSLFLHQPIKCLLRPLAGWSMCMAMTALRRAPAASSPTAPWPKRSCVSMDTVMLSSSSYPYQVTIDHGFTFRLMKRFLYRLQVTFLFMRYDRDDNTV